MRPSEVESPMWATAWQDVRRGVVGAGLPDGVAPAVGELVGAVALPGFADPAVDLVSAAGGSSEPMECEPAAALPGPEARTAPLSPAQATASTITAPIAAAQP